MTLGDNHVNEQPYHDGEIAVQERAGERDFARRHGAAIASRIVPGALPFLARQRLVALTAAGDEGHLWTSVWCGQPGFVQSADGQRVRILPSSMTASPDDPVKQRLARGRDVGILAIEFASRRRLRINGTVDEISADEIGVVVRESVPNCPKYIQRRVSYEESTASSNRRPSESGQTLDSERRAFIERADTAFVGSMHPSRGLDASHRGGPSGFIQAVDSTTLRIPDYPGNSMFLTLGNYEVDSRASLAVLDFDRGRVLSLSGTARLHFETDNPQHPTGGTGRYWDFIVRQWVEFEVPCGLRWELLDSSPFNPPGPRK